MQKTYKRYFWLFVLPTLLSFAVFFIIPFIEGFGLSFCKFTTVANAKFIGFGNYTKAFSNGDFVNSFLFTIKFAVVSVISVNVIAFALAYALTRSLKGTNIFRTVFFMPNLIGGIVLGYIWQLLLNGILAYVNATITTSAVYGFWGLVISSSWQMIGYMMVIYIAGIQNIPLDLIEAAKIDGANNRQILKDIIIPMMKASFTICIFLTLSNSFKLFDQNLALTAGKPGKDTTMLALDIFNTFYNRNGWEGAGQAKAVIFAIIVSSIAFLQLRASRNKEVEN